MNLLFAISGSYVNHPPLFRASDVRSDLKLNMKAGWAYPDKGRHRCSQVQGYHFFINLLMNTKHAVNQNGNIKITSSLNRDADQLLVKVTDNGHGIDKNNLSRIFDPFFTTRPTGQGTGKDLTARAILTLSSRSKESFVAVNCPTLPEQILESELFDIFINRAWERNGKPHYAGHSVFGRQ